MKKLLSIISISTIALFSFAQSGQKWATGGNGIGTGDFLGTTNNFALFFKVNSTLKMTLNTNGTLQLNNFGGSGLGLVKYDNNGVLVQLPFASPTDILYGNGTFGPINFSGSGWSVNGSDLYYNGTGNVGIGTNTPIYKLDVNGNIRVTGTVFTSGVLISNQVQSASANLGSINGTSTDITGNANVGGNVGIGTTNPSAKLDVFGNANVSGDINAGNLNVSGLTRLDTLGVHDILDSIKIGHSIILNGNTNRIYTECTNSDPCTGPSGLGIGLFTTGFSDNSIAIGRGIDNIHQLYNATPNSLMIGFNSNVPTLFVGPSSGNIGSFGKVGIGTSSPHCELDVNPPSGENGLCVTTDQQSGGFGILSLVNSDLANAIAVTNISSGAQNFIVYGDGFVLCRDLKVTLNALTHPDFVFKSGYDLISLDSLQDFISTTKHLPHFPSAEVVAANNGLSLAQTETSLLQTQEETTLYILQQHDEIKTLKQQMLEMKKQMDEQQMLINKLSNK